MMEILKLIVLSSAFASGTYIPDDFTCAGVDRSPPLRWEQAPAGTRSFVVICDDPDAPKGTWVHWILFNIPAEMNILQGNLPRDGRLPGGMIQGKNDFGKIGYNGPCPPKGKAHRYYFKVYALDTMLDLPPGATKAEVEKATKGHILARGFTMGLFRQ